MSRSSARRETRLGAGASRDINLSLNVLGQPRGLELGVMDAPSRARVEAADFGHDALAEHYRDRPHR
jgi:hypothetical protein